MPLRVPVGQDLPFLVESEGAPAGRRGAEGDLAVDKSISRGAAGWPSRGAQGERRRGGPDVAGRSSSHGGPRRDAGVDLSLDSVSTVGAWGR